MTKEQKIAELTNLIQTLDTELWTLKSGTQKYQDREKLKQEYIEKLEWIKEQNW